MTRRRLPGPLLEKLSCARAAAPQSTRQGGQAYGITEALRLLGWDPDSVEVQLAAWDRAHPLPPGLRPCCRTDPAGGHRGTCTESVMMSGAERQIVPPGWHQAAPLDAYPDLFICSCGLTFRSADGYAVCPNAAAPGCGPV